MDKDIKKIREIEQKALRMRLRKDSYRDGKMTARTGPYPDISEHGKLYGADDFKKAGYAREYLEEGARTGEVKYALRGAYEYERIGKGSKPYIIRKLIESAEKSVKKGIANPDYLKEVEKFIDRYSNPEKSERKMKTKGGSLEKKVHTIIAIAGIVFGLILLFPILTGNVINSTDSKIMGASNFNSSNILGVILLIVGIVFTFLALRQR